MPDTTKNKESLTEESLLDWAHATVCTGYDEVLTRDCISLDETGKQIIKNQEIIDKLREFLQDPLNNPKGDGFVFHNPQYGKFLREFLDS